MEAPHSTPPTASPDTSPTGVREILPFGRRRFLKQTSIGLLLLTAGNLRLPAFSLKSVRNPPSPTLLFFSEEEYTIVQAVARRMLGSACPIGPEPDQIDVALRADRFLSGADSDIQEQFHQLLVVFNSAVFTFLFDFRMSSFVNMSAQEQNAYLEDWMTSPLAFRRTAFQALKRLCASMYYTDRKSWPRISYTGMFLPGEQP